LRFAVRVGGTGDDRELRFTIPELAQSQLLLIAPAGAKYLQDVLGQGAQRVTPDAKGVHLEADLGRPKAVQVRWLQEKSQPQSLLVQVSEVYLWNLKAGADRLLGILQYTVSQGAAATFAITLPDEMEVRRVEVAPLQGGGAAPHLKEWRVTGPVPQHQLVLEFQVPITTGVQVFLDLVPRRPLGTSIVLPLPTPEGASFAAEGLLGYRVEGRQAELVQYQGVTGFNAEEFATLHWQAAGVDDPGPPERAYRFQRGPGAAPLLRLNLHLPRSHAGCTQELTWYLGPRRAELHALARLKAPAEELMMVEWEVPVQVRVASLSGPNVRSWSRTGSRVQVWLQRSLAGPAVETVFELYGWLTPARDQPIIPFRLPGLHIAAAAPQWTVVRVMADPGLALEASDLQNLWPVPDVRPSPADRAYVSKEAVYGGTFAVLPAAADADVRILTLAEVDKANLTFTATLDFQVRQGELRTFTVRLRNWEGPDVRVEAARVAGRREQRKDLAPAASPWKLLGKRSCPR
jgi:hypothetical protein